MSLLATLLSLALCVNLPDAIKDLHPPKHGVYVVAHRGAHQDIPENTLAAYQKAIDLGCDFVEIDLRTTKDGEFVSIHNNTVDAYTTDAKGPVKSFTLAELKALDIGSRIAPQWADERIPAFREILQLCKGKIGIYCDVKDADLEKASAIVREFDMQRQVLWYTNGKPLEVLKTACPECIEMPDPGVPALLPMLLEKKPPVIAAVWRAFSQDFAHQCHAANAIVIVDEDDADSWEPALQWGADGIQTDDPAGLIAFLKHRQTVP